MKVNKKMIKILFLFIFSIIPFSAFAEDFYSNKEIENIRICVKALEKRQWQEAYSAASKVKDPVLLEAVKWYKVIKDPSNETFKSLSKLYTNTQRWPDSAIIKMRVEESIDITMPSQEILDWFNKHPSGTSSGSKVYLEAMFNKYGTCEDVIKLAKSTWQTSNFSLQEEKIFINRFGDYITENEHYQKIDRLYWIERYDEANRNLFRLTKQDQKIFKTREALLKNRSNAISMMGTLSHKEQKNPGLIYAKLIWHESKKNQDHLYNLMEHIPSDPPFYSKWWEFKRRQISTLLEEKQYKKAYKLTSNHKHTHAAKYSDAEWLSGWIALRFLNKPELATQHFKKMYKVVKLPISLSRAEYWLGRSLEAEGKKDEANKWYELASMHSSTFYGQLSLLKINKSGKFQFENLEKITDKDYVSYKKNNFAKLAFIFSFHNNYNLSRQFVAKAIENAKSKGEIFLIANLGMKIKKYDLAIEAAKNASYKMVSIPNISYPTVALHHESDVEKALVHALIRQESMFNPRAESSAGALGLMQIMPATGKMLASSMKSGFDIKKLKHDFKYNIKLGVHYLEKLLSNNKGSYILTAASYNAGEHNVKKWIKRFGDPRSMNNVEDVVDWIELIPFYETRNYVQRILESTQIYRGILDKSPHHIIKIEHDIRRGN